MEKTLPKAPKQCVTQVMQEMQEGDVVNFPTAVYNYNTIRSTPATNLGALREKGYRWAVKRDFTNGIVKVTRLA